MSGGPTRWYERLLVRFGMTRPGAWLYSHLMPRLDRPLIARAGEARALTTTLSGYPVGTLTATGARSGLPRSTPLFYLEDGDRVILIASNFGKSAHPAWYHNLRAHPDVTFARNGTPRCYRARDADPAERARYWPRAVAMYPGYDRYRTRAAREIPIIILEPPSI